MSVQTVSYAIAELITLAILFYFYLLSQCHQLVFLYARTVDTLIIKSFTTTATTTTTTTTGR